MPKSIEKTVCLPDIAVLKEHLGLKPGEAIEHFFDWFDPINFKEEMLELLFDAMRSECAEFWDRRSRDHKIFLYEQVVKLVTAVYIRHKTPVRAKKAPPAVAES